jgi:hypothetical protein
MRGILRSNALRHHPRLKRCARSIDDRNCGLVA